MRGSGYNMVENRKKNKKVFMSSGNIQIIILVTHIKVQPKMCSITYVYIILMYVHSL